MLKKIRTWYLKHFDFCKYWEEYTTENYCKNCVDYGKKCKIDYDSGKCMSLD